VEVLISRFVTDPEMDLTPFSGTAMQIAFFKRTAFRYFDHVGFALRLRAHGISVRSVHAPAMDVYHQANDEFMTTLRLIREVYGVRVVTLHPQRGQKRQARRYFTRLADRIRELELTLAYETFEEGAFGTKWISQLEEMHTYFEIMEFPFLKVTYDFVHANLDRMMEEVARYHEKIQVIHLSDALRDRPIDPNVFHSHIPLGYGDYPVLEFLELLKRIRYRNFLVLEYHPKYEYLLRRDAEALAAFVSDAPEAGGGLRGLIEERRSHRFSADA
jgi:sugar phosphate isomerase/epimerase